MCEVISHCGFNFIFLKIGDVEHLFIYFLDICRFSLDECMLGPFAHFFFFCLLAFFRAPPGPMVVFCVGAASDL